MGVHREKGGSLADLAFLGLAALMVGWVLFLMFLPNRLRKSRSLPTQGFDYRGFVHARVRARDGLFHDMKNGFTGIEMTIRGHAIGVGAAPPLDKLGSLIRINRTIDATQT